ncbi:unnamed protein product [Schistosoma margrebowiei]|uniref:Uncharacterized protein n=1 Tax=Schistosoma margrebowiei TaxID=48269 RepID=A0A183N8R0_9TREM|nr:unnamed protein product [Schistosoma margrebowiei]
MGMITTNVLEESLSFGPLPTSLMIAEPAYLIAQTTTDRLSELPTIYADPKRLSDPIRLIEWVCNLRCARCPNEQNMELVYCHQLSQSFYRTTRRIEIGEELLIWFRRQDLQPLVTEYLNHLYISEAWIGNTVKATDLLQKDYEQFVNPHKSFNTEYCKLYYDDKVATERYSDNNNNNNNNNLIEVMNRSMLDPHLKSGSTGREFCSSKFQCSRCHDEFTYIYPYISHCLFKCQKQTIIQSIQWFNHHRFIESNEFPIELTNKYTYQKNIDLLLHNTMNTPLNQNKLDHLEKNTIENDDDYDVDDDDDDTQLTIETRSNKIGNQLKKVGNNEKMNELTSMKNFNPLHRKYLHRIQSNHKIVKPFKTLKQTTYIDNSSNNFYTKKSKLKTTLLPLKSRNPLVEQLLQTIMSHKIDSNVENNSSDLISNMTLSLKKPISSTSSSTTMATMTMTTTTTPTSPLISSLALAQNWCARCFITFRLTSDLVHHMRTCHNQGNKYSNVKDRLVSHHKTINTTDLINKRKQLSNENDNNNNEMGLLHSNGQSSISSLTTVRTSPQITITTATTTTHVIIKRKQLSNENDNNNNNEIGLLHSNGQSSISSLTTVRTSPQITITTATTTTTTTTTTVPSYCSTLNKPICSLCGEQFKEKHHLTRHMLSHT